jgi:hypothetical protein
LGQRLIIKNNLNGTTRSAIYYHWSAYTFEAIEEIKNLVSTAFWAMKVQPSELPNLSLEQHFDIACLKAVSGIPEHSKSSIDYINTLLPEPYDNSNVHRNDGLIAFDEVSQKSLIDWGEGMVTINWILDDKGEVDLDNTTFDFDVFFTMQEDKLHTNWDVPKSVIKQLKKFNYLIDLTDIPVASSDIFKAELKLLQKNLKKYLDDHSIEEQYDWWYDKKAKLFRSLIQ